eukprot:Amastigsp_a24_481.p4 type:complete len:124 gc:universal Amastigsp_a24_481:389-18(-)
MADRALENKSPWAETNRTHEELSRQARLERSWSYRAQGQRARTQRCFGDHLEGAPADGFALRTVAGHAHHGSPHSKRGMSGMCTGAKRRTLNSKRACSNSQRIVAAFLRQRFARLRHLPSFEV